MCVNELKLKYVSNDFTVHAVCHILVLFVPKDAVFGVVTLSVCLSVHCSYITHRLVPVFFSSAVLILVLV